MKTLNMKSLNDAYTWQLNINMKKIIFFLETLIKFIPLIFFSQILVACMTSEQMAANEEKARQQAVADRKIYLQRLGNRCTGYGFTAGTTANAQCIQNAEQQDDAQNANMIQLNMQSQQFQQQQFQRASCFATGRLDC